MKEENDAGLKDKKPKKNFNVEFDEEISKIPDYVPTAKRVKKGIRGISIFAKVMLGLIIVGLSVMLSFGIIYATQDVLGIGKVSSPSIIEVSQNWGLSQIADTLEEQGVIKSAFLFKAYYKIVKADVNFQYGTYSLNSNMAYDVILDELGKYSSSRDEIKVLIPEGTSLYKIGEILQVNGVCKSEEFIKVVNSTDFGYDFEKKITENKLKFHKMEGYLFPDTYIFYIGDNPVSVADKFLKNFSNKFSNEINQALAKSSLTQEELITIASIVQKEAGSSEHMKRVASVYLNRMNNPGEYARLQADPTRDYANELKLQMDRIDQEMLDAYNTYEGLGLPPGPICNPGLEAIMSVLEPEETDYFYFCNNLKTGEFFYAQTFEEHTANLRKAGLR